MSRRRRERDWTDEDDAPRSRRQRARRAGSRRIAILLLPALMIESLVVVVLRPERVAEATAKTKIVELDVVEPKPPALPVVGPRKKPQLPTRKAKRRRQRRSRRAARRAPQVAPKVTPTKPASAPEPVVKPNPGLLRMRAQPSKNGTLAVPRPPASKTDSFWVGRHKIQRKRYADGGRLLSNRSRAQVRAPERKGHYRTGKAPEGDAARLSLGGLASILGGGRSGTPCDHFKRFPVTGKSRTVHLLIDSSPSMSGSMSPAETCAIGVAHSAIQKGFAVAIGRFGSSTVCHQPTTNSNRLRDVIIDKKRIGGTRIPSICGAERAKTAVDIVVITDGGFFGSSLSKLLKARKVVAKPKNRGLLYLVPDPRFGPNKKALAAYRASGFRVVRFGPSARRRAKRRRHQSDGS
jgi:hypothetical protein